MFIRTPSENLLSLWFHQNFFSLFFLSFSFTFYFSSLQQNGSRYHLQVFCVRFRVKGDNFYKNNFYARHLHWPPVGDFVKCDFTDAMLSTRRLAPNVSKMFLLCFSHIFYPPWNIFCHIQKNVTVVINFENLLSTCQLFSTPLQQNQ